jgi:hypothetical protein
MSIKQNGGVFGRNPTFNDVTIEGDLIINGEVFTGLDFQGSWNASTNSPTLASSVGTNGEFYIVSVAGGTNLNGITNWGIGDWAIFNGTAWQRVEGGADGNFNDVTVAGTLGVTGEITANGGIALGDSDKATFGASDDLQIYHDGANSFIYEGGTGSLKIQAVNLNLQSTTGESYIDAVNNGSVYIYYDNAQKLTTTATGIDVTGTVTADGLTVDGTGTLSTIGNGTQQISTYVDSDEVSLLTGGSARLDLWTGGNRTMRLDANGDISFYEDTGTTAKLFWDASAESLGIGTSSPTSPLTVNRLSTDGTIASFEKDGTTVGSIGAGNTRLYAGSYDTGISFAYDVDTIRPYNTTTGADRDNAINLGSSAARFKDLYLSGGVYLGGTVAANTLDDYEEGTWTPIFADASTGGNVAAVGASLGSYTKVGNLVTVGCNLSDINISGLTSSNAIYIRGLPFVTGTTQIRSGSAFLDRVTFSGYVTAYATGSYV